MKKFQFSLDHVLDYKQQVLEGLQNEHAILMQRVRSQEELVGELWQRYWSCNRELREAEITGMTVAEAMRLESGLRFWEKEIEKNERLLEEYRRAAEDKRRQVVAARQDTASLEKLKDKKHQAYQLEVQKGEERFIEELVAAQRAMSAG